MNLWSGLLGAGPSQVKGRSGKYLLKKAFAKELPDSIKGRGKQGFGIPVSAWFRVRCMIGRVKCCWQMEVHCISGLTAPR